MQQVRQVRRDSLELVGLKVHLELRDLLVLAVPLAQLVLLVVLELLACPVHKVRKVILDFLDLKVRMEIQVQLVQRDLPVLRVTLALTVLRERPVHPDSLAVLVL